MSIIAKAPGKLFIVGEYAVTFPGYLAVVSSVPKYLTVELTPSDYNEIYSEQYPDTYLEWARECGALVPLGNNPFPIVTKTIETVEWYITELGMMPKNFELVIHSELDDGSGVKYGLGSSAAVSVATIQAMLEFYAIEKPPLLVYQLASIVQLRLKSHGSFGDIAASSFDTVIAYSSVDKEWLQKQLENYPLLTVLTMDWEKLVIRELVLPKDTGFLVGWTGQSANTEQLVADVKQTYTDSQQLEQFLQASQACVQDFITAVHANDKKGMRYALCHNRQLLQQLSPHIETKALHTLIEIAQENGATAKTSGAGGGDCGIALVDTQTTFANLLGAWKDNNVTPLFAIGGKLYDNTITFNA